MDIEVLKLIRLHRGLVSIEESTCSWPIDKRELIVYIFMRLLIPHSTILKLDIY